MALAPPEVRDRNIDEAASSLGIETMLDIATKALHRRTTGYRIYSMSKRWDNLSMCSISPGCVGGRCVGSFIGGMRDDN
jgi:hypothetical protein